MTENTTGGTLQTEKVSMVGDAIQKEDVSRQSKISIRDTNSNVSINSIHRQKTYQNKNQVLEVNSPAGDFSAGGNIRISQENMLLRSS